MGPVPAAQQTPPAERTQCPHPPTPPLAPRPPRACSPRSSASRAARTCWPSSAPFGRPRGRPSSRRSRSTAAIALRSNSAPGRSAPPTTDRQRSRSLLFQNIVLRREAEMTGNLPVEQVLNDLEPVLLDLANLPERASAEDLRDVRRRIEKKAIIAALQVYSARPAIASAMTD